MNASREESTRTALALRVPAALLALTLAAAGVCASLSRPVPSTDGTAQAANEIRVNDKVIATRDAPRPGEICAVCNQSVRAQDIVYVAEGQRIPIHSFELRRDVAAQVASLLAQRKPRGAFLGAGAEPAAAPAFWFWSGLYVLAGLLFGALGANLALRKGYGAVRWFVAGFLFLFFAYVILLTRPKKEVFAPGGVPAGLGKIGTTYAPEVHTCGAVNHPSAMRCTGCGARLEPKLVSEAQRMRARG